MMGTVIGASALAFMLHRLPRKSEVLEKPMVVKRPTVSSHSVKTHKIASARKNFKRHKSSGETQLSTRKLYG